MRRYMIDQMNSDYVKFARSGGLSEGEIFSKHIMKNAIIPITHGIPASVLGALTGAITTVCHTVLFMGLLALFFYRTGFIQGIAESLGTANVFAFILAFVGLQGLLEIVLAAIVVGALLPVLKKIRRA